MLNENIKTLRKQKGLSQEALAQKLNVVRQTVSKWEKGLSVPDADMLTQMADFFEVSVSELLGAKIDEAEADSHDEIAVQLAQINEELAKRNRHNKWVRRVIIAVVIVFFVLPLLFEAVLLLASLTTFVSFTDTSMKTQPVSLIAPFFP